MQLKLSVDSVQATSLGPESVAWFRLRGGTIGRSRDNDWVLPDPERIISSHHARIFYERGVYFIEDTSSNGTYLNESDAALASGRPTALSHGDILYIGDYEVRVELADEADTPHLAYSNAHASAADQQHSPDFVAKPYAPPPDYRQADPSTGNVAGSAREDPDPWADQHYPASIETPEDSAWGEVQSDHLAAHSVNFHPPSAAPEVIPSDISTPTSEALPDDWWKSDDGSPDISIPEAPPSPPNSEPDAAAQQQDAASSSGSTADGLAAIDHELPSGHEPRPTPARSLAATTIPPRPTRNSPPDPDQDIAEPSEPRISLATTMATRPDVTDPTDGAPKDPPAQLIAAYFEGLGMEPDTLSTAESEALLRQAGRLLRLLTQGTIDVLQARATLKSEFRLSQTIVRTAENNPLKFSLDAEQALQQFFVDKRPGFMGAEAAFSEALIDVKQHQIAVVAGMRAAFDCLLRKFSPETVEAARLASPKPRLRFYLGDQAWAFYQSYYNDFKENAGDDFQGIFGEDFVRAYEEQILLLTNKGAR